MRKTERKKAGRSLLERKLGLRREYLTYNETTSQWLRRSHLESRKKLRKRAGLRRVSLC
jgi:hypothetical protein